MLDEVIAEKCLESKEKPKPTIRRIIAFNRLLFFRGNAIVQTLCVGYLTISNLHARFPSLPEPVLAVAGMFGIWLLGVIEWKLGLWEAEAIEAWNVNPNQKRLTEKHA